MFFIEKTAFPPGRWKDVTYGKVMVYYKPEKNNPYQTRLTVGGDWVNYLGDCGTITVYLTTLKLLVDSIVLTLNAKFMTIDVKYFYSNTPMDRSEYMRLKLSNLPESVVQHYHIEGRPTETGMCMWK